jgi:hypothetical protein
VQLASAQPASAHGRRAASVARGPWPLPAAQAEAAVLPLRSCGPQGFGEEVFGQAMHGVRPPDRARSQCTERIPESAALRSDARVRLGRPSGTGSRIQFRRAAASLFQSIHSSLSSLSISSPDALASRLRTEGLKPIRSAAPLANEFHDLNDLFHRRARHGLH